MWLKFQPCDLGLLSKMYLWVVYHPRDHHAPGNAGISPRSRQCWNITMQNNVTSVVPTCFGSWKTGVIPQQHVFWQSYSMCSTCCGVLCLSPALCLGHHHSCSCISVESKYCHIHTLKHPLSSHTQRNLQKLRCEDKVTVNKCSQWVKL